MPGGFLPLEKCLGITNVADLMTKHLSASVINSYCESLAIDYFAGRSSIAQKLHTVAIANPPAEGIDAYAYVGRQKPTSIVNGGIAHLWLTLKV